MKASAQDIRLAAEYLFGARNGLSKEAVAGLMVDRIGFKQPEAEQLTAHWFTTERYRKRTASISSGDRK